MTEERGTYKVEGRPEERTFSIPLRPEHIAEGAVILDEFGAEDLYNALGFFLGKAEQEDRENG